VDEGNSIEEPETSFPEKLFSLKNPLEQRSETVSRQAKIGAAHRKICRMLTINDWRGAAHRKIGTFHLSVRCTFRIFLIYFATNLSRHCRFLALDLA